MPKVEVTVKVCFNVAYVVEVEDDTDAEAIRNALLQKDPSEWVSDPDFYEHLHDAMKFSLNTTTDNDIHQNKRVIE